MLTNLIPGCQTIVCIIFVLYKICSCRVYDPSISKNTSRVIDELFNGYDKRLRPYFRGPVLNVSVYMTVVSFGSMEEIDMEFTTDLFFKQAWDDPRLKHDLDYPIILVGEQKKRFWLPDTFFYNVKTAKSHSVPSENNRIMIYPTGKIELSERLTVSASCRLDLRNYPLDTQTCVLEILSYSYDVNDVDYRWKPKEDVIILDAEMSEFELAKATSDRKVVKYVIGAYTHLIASFVFKRRLAYSFIQIYAPTCLIVCMSWMSFWIHRDAVPARVSLGITTVLTIVTLMGSLRGSVPKVSYIKAIDSYLIVSFVFVFGVMLEYIAVLMHNQGKSNRNNKKRKDKEFCLAEIEVENALNSYPPKAITQALRRQGGYEINHSNEQPLPPRFEKKCVSKASDIDIIDRGARIVFPASFLFFNMVYWFTYAS